MLGAIAGDIIGSPYESTRNPPLADEFLLFGPDSRFTDDTVLTVAVAHVLMEGGGYVEAFHEYFWLYPDAGYGGRFFEWGKRRETEPYGSWGNGSAMRVSPIGYAFDTLEEVLDEAARSAEVTHDHPEGIKGAQAVAAAVFLARNGAGKAEIRRYLEATFGYPLDGTVAALRARGGFDVSCQGTVPQAVIAVLESRDYEDAVRKAVSIGGDTDTLAAMAGGIAEPLYGGVPPQIAEQAMSSLDSRLRAVTEQFRETYIGA